MEPVAADATSGAVHFELPEGLADLAEWVRERRSASGPTVVCVAGGTSTGKSTQVSAPLAAALGPDVCLLAQDMQQRSRRTEVDPRYGRDHPSIYGVDECLEAIERFRTGSPFEWPRFDFATRQPLEPQTVEPSDWLVIEGLYAASGSLAAAADVVLYVEAPAIVRLVRRVLRNQYERYPGRAVPGRTAQGFLGPVMRAHRDFVRPQRAQADALLRTSRPFRHLRERFDLPVLGVAPPQAVGRSIPFDDETEVTTVQGVDGIWRLRVVHAGACYVDCEIADEAAEALAALDPEEP